MRDRERLLALKKWVYETVCKGRQMKTPAAKNKITAILTQEPQVYLGFPPTRPDLTGKNPDNPANVYPGIVILPGSGYVKNVEEKRFDTYNKVHRPKEMGQTLSVSILFSVYEPGVRLPGFSDSEHSPLGLDMTKFQEGSETGLLTLVDWMDDLREAMLGIKTIPGTDLSLDEEKATYSPYMDQNYIVDKRPFFDGFINATFNGYATERTNGKIENLLK